MKHSLQPGQNVHLKVDRLGIHGEGVGRIRGLTLFVEGALPEERVQAQITEVKHSYARAQVLQIEHPSKDRTTPPCPFYTECGGCQTMHLNQSGQLLHKRQRVIDALERIGKLQHPHVDACVPSDLPLGYRNKVQVHCREGFIGFLKRGTHQIIDIPRCLVHCPLGEKVYQTVRQLTANIPIRYVVLRTAFQTEEVMCVFVSSNPPTDKLKKIASELKHRHREVKSIFHNHNPTPGNVVLGARYTLLEGQTTIREVLLGKEFLLSPSAFFQVNPLQTEKLYTHALHLASILPTDRVLDTFCGVGTLSILASQQAKEVVGVECIESAVTNARQNAHLNQATNVTFFNTRVENWIDKSTDRFDVVLMNPPRKGCAQGVLDALGRSLPKKIVYISCDPATLARDIQKLCLKGYQIKRVTPFDLFPQTAHVETVVLLTRPPLKKGSQLAGKNSAALQSAPLKYFGNCEWKFSEV